MFGLSLRLPRFWVKKRCQEPIWKNGFARLDQTTNLAPDTFSRLPFSRLPDLRRFGFATIICYNYYCELNGRLYYRRGYPTEDFMLNIKKWNAICWLLVLAWFVPSIAINIPSVALEFAPQPPEVSGPLAAGGVFMVVSTDFPIGWPFKYLDVRMLSSKKNINTYHPAFVVLNSVLIILTTFCLIYSVQTLIPRFSILAVMILTALIALILTYIGYVVSNNTVEKHTGYLLAIYFLPIYFAIIAFVFCRPKTDAWIAR